MLSAGLKGPDSMEFLYLVIAVLAVAVVYLRQDRADLRRRIANRLIVESRERRRIAHYQTRIFERLSLSKTILPNPTVAIYSAVVDAYDCIELMPHGLPIEAIDEHTIHWKKNIQNFTDDELLELWLIGVIECPAS